MDELNPHGKHMADESMVRTLAAQTEAIWPQELPLFARYGLAGPIRILDAGCGTGECSARIADLYPQSQILGIDIVETSLEAARVRCAALASRVRFENQSFFEMREPAASCDLTLCRHVLHSVPQAERVIAALVRVTKPGGWLHLIPEDYGMIHFQNGSHDLRRFWDETPVQFAEATGTDLFIGRNAFSILAGLGLENIRMDYVVVDTLRVPRETFARIFTAWRDGYADSIGELTPMSREDARACFDQMLHDLRDPQRYAVWFVPVLSGRVPGVPKLPN